MTAAEDKTREIARLRALIASEYQAIRQDAQGFTGDTRHAFVTERMKVIWGYFEELAALVGSHEEAMALVVESFPQAGHAPTFLQVGATFINLAHITMVTGQESGISVSLTGEVEALTFEGDEAALFMRVFKQHCQIRP